MNNNQEVKQEVNQLSSNIPTVKSKKNLKTFIIILVIISVVTIGTGIYINYIGNSKRVIATAIDKISTSLKNTVNLNENNKVGENFTLKSNLKLDVESDYLEALSTYSTDYTPYINLLKNLSKTDNDITFIQNKDEKKLLATLSSNLNGTELMNTKYLIQNNTQYYFIKDFLTTYINGGNSDYFEALDSNTTSTKNMEYIYDFSIKSLKNNLKDSYFKKEVTDISQNNKKISVNKISLIINNDNLKELATNILKDLKEDQRANKILTGIDSNFKDSKVSQDVTILESDESIIFNVYTDKLTYQAKKYEILLTSTTNIFSIDYEVINKKSYVNLKSNNETLGKLEITKDSNKTSVDVKDAKDKTIATIVLTKTDTNTNVIVNATIETLKIDMTIDSKTTEVKKNFEYDTTSSFNIKLTSENTVMANATVKLTSKLTNDAKISEDVSTSVLSSSITSQQSEQLQTKLSTILLSLMS